MWVGFVFVFSFLQEDFSMLEKILPLDLQEIMPLTSDLPLFYRTCVSVYIYI